MRLPWAADEGLERRIVPLKAYRLICEKRFDAINQQQYCGVEGKRHIRVYGLPTGGTED